MLDLTVRQDVNSVPCRIGRGSFVLGSEQGERVTHAENHRRRHGDGVMQASGGPTEDPTKGFKFLRTSSPMLS
jgi:hypothetical protein